MQVLQRSRMHLRLYVETSNPEGKEMNILLNVLAGFLGVVFALVLIRPFFWVVDKIWDWWDRILDK
jgi:hypothetical protein